LHFGSWATRFGLLDLSGPGRLARHEIRKASAPTEAFAFSGVFLGAHSPLSNELQVRRAGSLRGRISLWLQASRMTARPRLYRLEIETNHWSPRSSLRGDGQYEAVAKTSVFACHVLGLRPRFGVADSPKTGANPSLVSIAKARSPKRAFAFLSVLLVDNPPRLKQLLHDRAPATEPVA
jgi:hypothetical protein